MTDAISIPALCFGEEYRSLNLHPITDLGTGERLGSLSFVVENRIATDCKRDRALERGRAKLLEIPVQRRIAMAVEAADIFEHATLDGGGVSQSPEEYTELLSRTSGLPLTLARDNTARVAAALRKTEGVVDGLSRGLPREIYDTGLGKQGGSTVRLVPNIPALGCVMPNNSPGVHVTWLPAPVFGFPVVLRPGSSEPFTPFRLIQAHIEAGYPKEAFGFYPCDHQAASRIPDLTKGAIVFGSDATVKQWANNPLVQRHGSGFSKLFVGDELMSNWEVLISELAENIAANSGRSCFAVSRIVVPRYGKEIAAALAAELAKIVPTKRDDPAARLSAMAMPKVAVSVNDLIDSHLKKGGAVDYSLLARGGKSRLEVFEGRTYLHPTVIHCDSSNHPLANQEFLFPFAAVVESSIDDAFMQMGPTLSLAVYTADEALKLRARMSGVSLVSVNIGTSKLDRCQPHEENLFELFFRRLSFVERI